MSDCQGDGYWRRAVAAFLFLLALILVPFVSIYQNLRSCLGLPSRNIHFYLKEIRFLAYIACPELGGPALPVYGSAMDQPDAVLPLPPLYIPTGEDGGGNRIQGVDSLEQDDNGKTDSRNPKSAFRKGGTRRRNTLSPNSRNTRDASNHPPTYNESGTRIWPRSALPSPTFRGRRIRRVRSVSQIGRFTLSGKRRTSPKKFVPAYQLQFHSPRLSQPRRSPKTLERSPPRSQTTKLCPRSHSGSSRTDKSTQRVSQAGKLHRSLPCLNKASLGSSQARKSSFDAAFHGNATANFILPKAPSFGELQRARREVATNLKADVEIRFDKPHASQNCDPETEAAQPHEPFAFAQGVSPESEKNVETETFGTEPQQSVSTEAFETVFDEKDWLDDEASGAGDTRQESEEEDEITTKESDEAAAGGGEKDDEGEFEESEIRQDGEEEEEETKEGKEKETDAENEAAAWTTRDVQEKGFPDEGEARDQPADPEVEEEAQTESIDGVEGLQEVSPPSVEEAEVNREMDEEAAESEAGDDNGLESVDGLQGYQEASGSSSIKNDGLGHTIQPPSTISHDMRREEEAAGSEPETDSHNEFPSVEQVTQSSCAENIEASSSNVIQKHCKGIKRKLDDLRCTVDDVQEFDERTEDVKTHFLRRMAEAVARIQLERRKQDDVRYVRTGLETSRNVDRDGGAGLQAQQPSQNLVPNVFPDTTEPPLLLSTSSPFTSLKPSQNSGITCATPLAPTAKAAGITGRFSTASLSTPSPPCSPKSSSRAPGLLLVPSGPKSSTVASRHTSSSSSPVDASGSSPGFETQKESPEVETQARLSGDQIARNEEREAAVQMGAPVGEMIQDVVMLNHSASSEVGEERSPRTMEKKGAVVTEKDIVEGEEGKFGMEGIFAGKSEDMVEKVGEAIQVVTVGAEDGIDESQCPIGVEKGEFEVRQVEIDPTGEVETEESEDRMHSDSSDVAEAGAIKIEDDREDKDEEEETGSPTSPTASVEVMYSDPEETCAEDPIDAPTPFRRSRPAFLPNRPTSTTSPHSDQEESSNPWIQLRTPGNSQRASPRAPADGAQDPADVPPLALDSRAFPTPGPAEPWIGPGSAPRSATPPHELAEVLIENPTNSKVLGKPKVLGEVGIRSPSADRLLFESSPTSLSQSQSQSRPIVQLPQTKAPLSQHPPTKPAFPPGTKPSSPQNPRPPQSSPNMDAATTHDELLDVRTAEPLSPDPSTRPAVPMVRMGDSPALSLSPGGSAASSVEARQTVEIFILPGPTHPIARLALAPHDVPLVPPPSLIPPPPARHSTICAPKAASVAPTATASASASASPSPPSGRWVATSVTKITPTKGLDEWFRRGWKDVVPPIADGDGGVRAPPPSVVGSPFVATTAADANSIAPPRRGAASASRNVLPPAEARALAADWLTRLPQQPDLMGWLWEEKMEIWWDKWLGRGEERERW